MKVYSKARSCWVSLTDPNEQLDPMVNLREGDSITFKIESEADAHTLEGVINGLRYMQKWLRSGLLKGLSGASLNQKVYELLESESKQIIP